MHFRDRTGAYSSFCVVDGVSRPTAIDVAMLEQDELEAAAVLVMKAFGAQPIGTVSVTVVEVRPRGERIDREWWLDWKLGWRTSHSRAESAAL